MKNVEPDPRVLKVLQELGYRNFQIKYRKIHARRNRDHLIIKLNKKGMPLTHRPDLISAHQDVVIETPPYHHADFNEGKRLIKEFIHAWMQEIKSSHELENGDVIVKR